MLRTTIISTRKVNFETAQTLSSPKLLPLPDGVNFPFKINGISEFLTHQHSSDSTEKEKTHRSPPGHVGIAAVPPHPDMTFHELL